MSPRDIAKQRMKRDLYWGIALLLTCTVPFVICALKSAYANHLPVLSDIVGNIYLSSSKLQYLWEWSVFPAFQPEAGISVGNVFAVLFAVGFLYALAALQSAWQQPCVMTDSNVKAVTTNCVTISDAE